MRAPGHRGRAADSGPAPVRVSAPPLSGRVTPASGGPDRAGSRVPSPAHRPGSSPGRPDRGGMTKMNDSRVTITGIRAGGRHGANPGERLESQEFVVDLDVLVAVREDSLDATADYAALTDAARDAVASNSFELLETLADAVARAVFQYEGVMRVTAAVHKPGAAAALGVDDVVAEAMVG